MQDLSRRTLLTASCALFIGQASFAIAQDERATRPPGPFDEYQRGDPEADYETVRLDPDSIARLSTPQRATFNERNSDFGATLLSVAGRFIGVDRDNNAQQVTSFLDLFDLPFHNSVGGNVPYCASGLTYAAAVAYHEYWNATAPTLSLETVRISALRQTFPELDHYHFYPSPSVFDMFYVAMGKRRWREAARAEVKPTPEPGWIVVFNFGRTADHCGIVESMDGNVLNTIEFNTSNGLQGDQRNGGMVARRRRNYDASVMGFIDV